MKRILVGVLALALGATAVVAQSDPIAARKAAMRSLVAKLSDVNKIAKGEATFDLAKVQAGLKAIVDVSKTQPALFTEDSKTGGDTTASPKIWENKADFDARYAKLGADAAAAESKIVDEATFKVEYPLVTKNCGNCHEMYRVRKN